MGVARCDLNLLVTDISSSSSMPTEPIPIGCTAIKPVERHGLEAIKWFLYDKETGAIMGRTPMSWLLITVFYIIYYACLAGFWVLCLTIFFQFIDDKEPKWQQEGGLIGNSPALGVRPGQDADMIESSMIIFNYEADKYLEPYRKDFANGVDCASKEPADGEFCKFDL